MLITGIFYHRSEADAAIRRLHTIGIPERSIGLVIRDGGAAAPPAPEVDAGESAQEHTKAAEGAGVGAASGAGLGALVGLALAGTTLLIPGVGPIVVAGHLARIVGAHPGITPWQARTVLAALAVNRDG